MNTCRNLLRNIADEHQELIAVIQPRRDALTYADLAVRVAALATELTDRDIGAGDTVGICLPKTIDSVICLLAILDAGAAYVAVDASGAMQRNGLILSDSCVSAVFIENSRMSELEAELSCQGNSVAVTSVEVSLLECRWGDELSPGYADDLAMLLYTSGSTGVPKGVQITDSNAATFVDWARRMFYVRKGDIVASIAPFHFDLSLFDLYVSLAEHATILLLDQKTCQNTLALSHSFQQYKVSICYTTPTVLKMLLNFGRLDRYDHSALRQVLFAGEVLASDTLTQLKRYWPQVEFYNLYGPTESNVITCYQVPEQFMETGQHAISMGVCCDYAELKLLIHGMLMDIGADMEGELVVSGPSVTPGYLNDENKNSEAFICSGEGKRYYRTGDFVRVSDEGLLQFVTRKDRMVKRRGYRIELDEIEAILATHDSALEVAVSAVSDAEDTTIVAYFCQRAVLPPVDRIQLQRFFLQHLPISFLPDQFLFIEVLPKTSSGKINYQRLRQLEL